MYTLERVCFACFPLEKRIDVERVRIASKQQQLLSLQSHVFGTRGYYALFAHVRLLASISVSNFSPLIWTAKPSGVRSTCVRWSDLRVQLYHQVHFLPTSLHA